MLPADRGGAAGADGRLVACSPTRRRPQADGVGGGVRRDRRRAADRLGPRPGRPGHAGAARARRGRRRAAGHAARVAVRRPDGSAVRLHERQRGAAGRRRGRGRGGRRCTAPCRGGWPPRWWPSCWRGVCLVEGAQTAAIACVAGRRVGAAARPRPDVGVGRARRGLGRRTGAADGGLGRRGRPAPGRPGQRAVRGAVRALDGGLGPARRRAALRGRRRAGSPWRARPPPTRTWRGRTPRCSRPARSSAGSGSGCWCSSSCGRCVATGPRRRAARCCCCCRPRSTTSFTSAACCWCRRSSSAEHWRRPGQRGSPG